MKMIQVSEEQFDMVCKGYDSLNVREGMFHGIGDQVHRYYDDETTGLLIAETLKSQGRTVYAVSEDQAKKITPEK